MWKQALHEVGLRRRRGGGRPARHPVSVERHLPGHAADSAHSTPSSVSARSCVIARNAPIGHEVVSVEIDGVLVGQCMLRLDTDSTEPATAEVAYRLGRVHRGRGAMSRILPAIVERSFERHPVDEIDAWILPGNTASIRVAEHAGLVRTAVPNEGELAASQSRPGFLRWAISRPA